MKTMKPNRFFADILTIGFALFSMFFGAGNVIFPPYLGLQSGRLWFGKFLTPALLLGLAVMILVGIIHPIGHVSDTVLVDNVLVTGIEAGYQTLDVLAALVFGAVLVKSAEEKGYHEEKSRLRVLIGASVVAGVLLLLVYLGLAWLGASASEVYPPDISRASLVISIVQRLLGRPGLVLFSVVVALACITTAVGLVSSTADHFATISRRKLSYRLCVIVICVFSAFVSNLGLDSIISIAAPILGLVYPPVQVLLAVSLLMPHISNSICISAVLGALFMSVLSTADSLGLSMPWLHRMPLANVDMAWILPSVLCGVAAFLYRLPWLERAED